MPAHDWTRVDEGIFHDFHIGWVSQLARVLNTGLLPEPTYVLVARLDRDLKPRPHPVGAPASYAARRRTLVIHHERDHRVVALIEIVSPGNKSSRHAIRSFVDKALAALSRGIHRLLLDLHPPGPRDPNGVHGLIWEELTGETYQAPADKPLTLAAYAAGLEKTASVQPVAVGEELPEMPLFLTPDEYINVPLEPTYARAYEGVPRFYRRLLEA